MNKSISLTVLVMLFLLSACKTQSELARKKELKKYIHQLEEKGEYGSVLLMEKDSLFFHEGFGYANKEKGLKNTAQTIFPFGSIVKDYTRTATLLLAVDGKLHIDSTISFYLNNVPEDKKHITIQHLLQHKSGLDAYHDGDPKLRELYPNRPADLFPMTRDEALLEILNQELLFEPGADESYSNSGYTLLALILEKVSGKSFEDLLRERIFIPAQMTTTDFSGSQLWKPEDMAIGYGRLGFGKENSPYYWPRNPLPTFGNGGLSGSLMDIYKGLRFMMRLEAENSQYAELSKMYKYIEDMPQDIVGSSGGNDMGYVTVIFGLISKEQYMIYATNNDRDGMEDVNVLRNLFMKAFDFDVASLALGEFDDMDEETEKEKIYLDSSNTSEWGLPPMPKYSRVSAFLDIISNNGHTSMEDFLNDHCSKALVKAGKETIASWVSPNPLKLKRVESYGSEFLIVVEDSVDSKELKFQLYLQESKAKRIVGIRSMD